MNARALSWFDLATSQPRRSHFAESDGVAVHYVSWNGADTNKPPLLFAHGFLGHAHWWDFIAPFFTDRFRVFALDFSGMGDSGHRREYSAGVFARDLVAVMDSIGSGPCIAVGHSFGGSRLLHACATFPDRLSRAIVLDSFFMLRGDSLPAVERRPPPRPYPDAHTAVSRFRLIPEQECEPWLLEHLARTSLRQTTEGWVWRFDPKLRDLQPVEGEEDLLSRIAVPVCYVHAERSSVVSAERARRIAAAIPGAKGPITMPRAGHHMMLDQPLELVSVLGTLLA
ncbi:MULTISPECIES: alpha/beta fold hydrolase [Burkholderia cepacia complex]|uniref:alpha/beta fold hydrolase n=1 Tax=Burkholderia cepacia complex TaxID=87882 RepID=UPI0006794EEF|nr:MULTISPECIES: alpha/beta hydrolase [Burkholderia cepacia complex]KWU23479.1 alpha/beta hydrolase [Burkholderia cenocepacia]MBY4798415.1 alpha/beta hydrolase [Burkholderia cepacia]RQV54747.1 alpha/beta hydrolase [Burkholderia cenocepacia]CAG2360579.1 alpha/beta hydrolase [Burkholderia cenocepacia]CAG2360601.1 alpha/beta hydrolase [Burkholderia cenocepacia]